MARSSFTSSLSARLLAGVALAAFMVAAPTAQAGLLDKLTGKSDTPAAAAKAPEAAKTTPAKAETAKEEPAKTEDIKTPDSYKAGNLEISHISASEKNGGYEIYLKLTNNGKNDDGLSGAELVEGTGEIVMVAKNTTKEITNKDAIEKAQQEARRRVPTPVLPVHDAGEEAKDAKDAIKEAKKPDAPKPVDIPKPEYKEVVKEVEGAIMVSVPADKSVTLESGETRLKLTGYKKSLKEGDVFKIMLHFRSAPNATVAVKLTNKQSLLNKVFGN